MANLTTREIVESIIFAVPDAYTADELSLKINRKKEDVEKALQEMAGDYRNRNSVIAIEEVNGRFAMILRRDIAPQLKRFIREAELTPYELKVLAIISKHSGIMKGQMAKAMGSGVYDHIRSLVDKGFVQESRIGRSTSLRTTAKVPDIDKIIAMQAAAQQSTVQKRLETAEKQAENPEPQDQDPPEQQPQQ